MTELGVMAVQNRHTGAVAAIHGGRSFVLSGLISIPALWRFQVSMQLASPAGTTQSGLCGAARSVGRWGARMKGPGLLL